jgi:hypothetical protein
MWYIHVILSNTKEGRGALNHIFLPNIGIGACALFALAHLVYDNLFVCGAINRISQRFLGANQEWYEQTCPGGQAKNQIGPKFISREALT